MSTKIKINLDDPQVRKVWEAALEAQREFESWPAWKRGEEEPGGAEAGVTDPPLSKAPSQR